MEILECYMNNGFIFWPLKLNFENFKAHLNNMHPLIKFMFENPEIIYENEKKVQALNFLDVKIILHKDNSVTNQQILTTTYHTTVYTLIIQKKNYLTT